MKTRSPDQQPGHGLPPPPAPPARDANPWQMSSGAGGQRQAPRHARAPGWLRRPGSPQPGPAGRKRRLSWVPLLVMLFIAGAAVQLAIAALAERDAGALAAAIVMLVLTGFAGLRLIGKRGD